MGYAQCNDFSGPLPEGFGYRQVTQRNGRRMSVATAYLDPVKHRPNLHIVTGALIDLLLFDGKKATGVRYLAGTEEHQITARREILLAAGVFGSPAILQRSGIGHAELLRDQGIGIVHHSPGVGTNLQDHPAVALSYDTDNTEPYGISLRVAPRLVWDAIQYVLFRRGLLASNVLEGGAYIRSEPALSRPDIQYSFMPARRTVSRNIGWGHGYGMSTIVLRPESRGSVRIADSNPSNDPSIDLGLLTDDRDVHLMLCGLKLARRVLNASAFSEYGGRELTPGAAVQDDTMLIDFIRRNCGTAFHPVGTCAMGRDAMHVVNADLNVRGVEGLRVADASIMPTLIGGNTNAPTVMIAEVAADLALHGQRRL
jgi:choline dehydrogenase